MRNTNIVVCESFITLDDALHVDSRQVDLVGVQLAWLHELLHLCNAHLTGLQINKDQ